MTELIKPDGKKLDYIYFGFWLVVFICLQMLHVPWRDEFQPWLIAVNTSSVAEFFHAIWYERQPPFQYFLLWLFHKVVGSSLSPLASVRLVSDVFTMGMVALIVFALRLPRTVRYLLPFTIFYFREYGVIARNYPMGVFFLLAAIWAYRKSKPALFCILLIFAATVHLFFTWMATILALIYFWEHRCEWKSILKYIAPVLLISLGVVIFLRPPPESPFSAHMVILSWESLIEVFKTLARTFTGFGRFYGLDFQFQWWFLIPGVALFGAYIWAVFTGGVSSWRFWLLSAFPLFVSATTYNPDTRHAGTMFTALVLAWLLSPRAKSHLLTLSSAVACLSTCVWLYAWRPDLNPAHMNHSGAKDFLKKYGAMIKNNDVVVLTDMDKYFFSPMGMAGFSIFDVRRNREVRYPYYRDSEYLYTWETWCKQFGEEFARQHANKIFVLGVTKGFKPSESCGCLSLDFETPNPAITDEISVYRWTPNQSCAAGR